MLTRLYALLTMLVLALPAAADEAKIQGTITGQIDRFLVDDFVGAFDYAAPSIKNIFRTPENFGRMVSQGYPMVWRPADVEYLELRAEGAVRVQKVLITDQKGGVHILDYRMIETAEGWKISGVVLLDSSAVAA
ncbi:MAG: DUF4864 domain-containing protein [Pseudomonadota bacterium]